MKIGLVQAIYMTQPRHLELAKITLDSIHTEHEVIKIASVTRCDSPEMREWVDKNYDHVVINPINILARAWNKGIRLAFNELHCDYVLLSNTDVMFQKECINNLVEAAENCQHNLDNEKIVAWCSNIIDGEGVRTEPPKDFNKLSGTHKDGFNACVCLLSTELQNTVGLFYENFKGAYFEDIDLSERIQDDGYGAVTINYAKVFHYGSQTILNDSIVRKMNDVNFENNRIIYLDRSRFRKVHLLK